MRDAFAELFHELPSQGQVLEFSFGEDFAEEFLQQVLVIGSGDDLQKLGGGGLCFVSMHRNKIA